jgi:TldD protein
MASDFSRRDFLATGGAVVAGVFVPDWAAAFQPGTSDNARRTEVTDAALAHAAKIGASYADIRINRYRRESITTREQQVQNVSRSTSYGFGVRVLVNGAWGFAASNLVEPAAARTAAEQAVAIAKANAILAARKITLAHADRTVTTWTSAFKKDPFEVPLETKIAFLLKLNQTALVPGVSFVTSQILFADEQKYFASSEGSRITQRLIRTYPQFQTTATDRASGDFQTRPVVDRAKLMGYEYVEEYPWLADAEKAGHEVVEKLRAKPVSAGRYDIVVDPSQLFLAIHESVGHSTELDRALGYEANSAGTSFLKPGCGHAALWLEHRQHCRRSHATRRPCHHGL